MEPYSESLNQRIPEPMNHHTMKLQLLHGRTDPTTEMNRTGFQGPCIEELDAMCVVYNNIHRLIFADRVAAHIAKEQTGWESWDDLTLEMRIDQDMVRIDTPDGGTQWFGDWHITAANI